MHAINLLVLTVLNSDVRFKSFAIVSVGVGSHAVADSVMSNVSNISVASLFLHEVMLAGPVNGEVLGDVL